MKIKKLAIAISKVKKRPLKNRIGFMVVKLIIPMKQ